LRHLKSRSKPKGQFIIWRLPRLIQIFGIPIQEGNTNTRAQMIACLYQLLTMRDSTKSSDYKSFNFYIMGSELSSLQYHGYKEEADELSSNETVEILHLSWTFRCFCRRRQCQINVLSHNRTIEGFRLKY
jgi:hypothetical protein